MAYIVMAYILVAYIVMAYAVMAYLAMVHTHLTLCPKNMSKQHGYTHFWSHAQRHVCHGFWTHVVWAGCERKFLFFDKSRYTCRQACLSTCPNTCLSTCLNKCLNTCLNVCLNTCLGTCLDTCLHTFPSACRVWLVDVIVMAYKVMAYEVMAYLVLLVDVSMHWCSTDCYGPHSYVLYSYGPHSYGLYSYGPYCSGVDSYGLYRRVYALLGTHCPTASVCRKFRNRHVHTHV